MLALMNEIERLKQIREDVVAGQRQADNILKAEMYITQLGLSAYKIILDGLKESAKIELTQNNYTQVDISAQVNDLIKFSRERQCSKHQATQSS
jgi:predicted transcriptional regulator